MSGPYNLKYIHLFVTEVSSGAYILSRNGRMADRVGHATENLAQDLNREAVEAKYRYFWFEYAGKVAAAHDLECAWYHRYHPTDNIQHPLLGGEMRCSVKGCSEAVTALAGRQRPL